jgi:hypothetical protein
MMVRGRNSFGFSGALSVLPLAGILFASLTACSVGDTTTAPSAQSYDDQDLAPLQVDPPALEDGSENGGSPPADDGDTGGGGKNGDPPSSDDTFGEDH